MKPKVAFICVHNSCRSQIAEALGRYFASDVFDAYSGGTELVEHINNDAVRIIKDMYNVDMSSQYSKMISDLPEMDIVVKMGCNVACPYLPSKYEEDWGLEDPSGKDDYEFIKTAKTIEIRIKELANKIKNKEVDLNL